MVNNKKWSVVISLSVAIAIAYIFRTNISTLIISMSNELQINEKQQGVILSSFYIGYVLFMLIGGLLADKFGAYKTLAISVALLSIDTLLLAFANNYSTVLILRFLTGVFQAPMFPACAKLVNKSFQNNERGRATSIFDSGAYIGAAVCVPIIVWIMTTYNWRFAYVICSVIGFL